MKWLDKLLGKSTDAMNIEEKRKVIKETLSGREQEKALANLDKEPWVKVLNIQFNPEDPQKGFFELDWNEHFVEQLAQNGYSGATPEAIVDQWFTDLCKGIARQQQESGSFVVNEDVIKMSDLQREENEKDKDDE